MLLSKIDCTAHPLLMQGDGNHSGIPSIKPSSTPKGSTPKAGTPKAALTRCPSEVENDDGEEVIFPAP